MEPVAIRPFSEGEACAVASWAYEPPYDFYDGDSTRFEDYLVIDDGDYGFYALVVGSQDVVGFCCFGDEARVPGQVTIDGVVDIGGGIRPDLVSQRIATGVLPAVIGYAKVTFRPTHVRTAVASFNERSIRLCLSAGFTVVRRFDGPTHDFHEMLRKV